MSCAACSTGVERALLALPGLSGATVNLPLEQVRITYDASRITIASFIQAIENAGFEVPVETSILEIGGMSCAACSSAVEKALSSCTGVIDARVNLALERAEIDHITSIADMRALVKCVEDSGFEASPARYDKYNRQERRDAEARKNSRDLIELAISAALTLPLMAHMIAEAAGLAFSLPPILKLALATPVQFWIGRRFYKGAWKSIRARAANMDVLVALGTSAAFFYSLAMLIKSGADAEGHLYFTGAAVIITLVLLGKILEARARRGASAAIAALAALRPETARVERSGKVYEIAIGAVKTGDIVLVKSGERIPVDGEIIEGRSETDDSLITGESLPVVKAPGDNVTGGAINGSGFLRISATHIGEQSLLGRMISLVEEAQLHKAPVQRMVDRVSAVFVPVVIGISFTSFCGWLALGGSFEQALIASVSVLVIACPCALGLATPTAIVAGTGAAAKAGILIRDIEALEKAHLVNMAVFDKTGTLTEGKPHVAGILPLAGSDENTILTLAASIQMASEHPLGEAMVIKAEELGLEIARSKDVSSIPGEGIKGYFGDQEILIGNMEFMQNNNIPAKQLEKLIAQTEARGETPVCIAADGRPLGVIGLIDPLRETAAEAIDILNKRGIDTLLLSGDSERITKMIAEKAGVLRHQGAMKPQDKVNTIVEMQQKGTKIVMIGDGVNDAPALATADIGIAMGSGTDVAMQTAGITLMRPDPRLAGAALDISRATRRKIIQNLFWAFIYNLVGIPLAALGMLNPAFAGAAMAMSSVSVVSNSVFLRNWRPHFTKTKS